MVLVSHRPLFAPTFIQHLGVLALVCREHSSIAGRQGIQMLSRCGRILVVDFANSLNHELLYAVHADRSYEDCHDAFDFCPLC